MLVRFKLATYAASTAFKKAFWQPFIAEEGLLFLTAFEGMVPVLHHWLGVLQCKTSKAG